MNLIEGDANMYNSTGMGYRGVPLLSGTTTAETLLPAYNSVIVDSSVSPKTAAVSAAMKSDSGLSYNYTLPLPRKRARECMIMNPFTSYPSVPASKSCGSFSFLGEDISLQIHQQQNDIDRLVSQHVSLLNPNSISCLVVCLISEFEFGTDTYIWVLFVISSWRR